jgi:predicted aspartyl protease
MDDVTSGRKFMNKRLSSLLVFLLLLAGAGASLVYHKPQILAVARQSTQRSSSSTVTVPFDLINKHILLKVMVNNSRPLSFVLDTGDQYAIINLELAKELGLTLRGQVRVGGAGAATNRSVCR